MAHTGIGEGISGQASLHCFLPFAALTEVFDMPFAHALASGGDVVKVICFVRWKLNIFEWMQIEELLRGIPRKVWQVNSTTEEKGFVVILF